MVGEKGKVNLSVLFIGVFLSVLTIYFVFAAHTVTLSDGQSWFKPVEDANYVFNITINNTDTNLVTANITRVNITIPDTFAFTAGTNGTTGLAVSFSNTSTLLSWQNSSGVIPNWTTSYFWFNATASTPGNYTINVSTQNSTSIMNTSLTVVVNDTTAPATIDFVSPTPSTRSNLSQSFLAVNVTATDNGVIDRILLRFYNSTHQLTNTTTSSSSPLFVNLTSLSDGVYYINATVNDTYNNQNSTTSTLNITLDTTNPLVDYGLLTEVNNSNKSQSWVYVNVSVTETNEINITFSLYNSTSSVNITNFSAGTRTINWTGLSDGNYSYNVTVRDYSSNSNSTSTRTMTLDATNPLINFGASGNADNDSSAERDWVYVNVSVTETNEANITFSLYNSTSSVNITNFTAGTRTINWTSLPRVAYFYNITVRDYSGNSNDTITRKITLTSPSSTPATSSGGGGNSANPWNKGTFAINDKQLQEGYTKNMIAKQRLRLNIAVGSHYVGVKEVTGDYVKIEATSTPQEKTLSAGEEWRVEVSNDNFYDLLVKANSIEGGVVSLTVRSINEQIPEEEPIQPPEEIEEETPKITGEVVEGTGRGDSWPIWVLAIIVIVVLILIFLKLRKKKK